MTGVLILFLAASAWTLPTEASAQRRAQSLPADVQRFIGKRDRCDHFRGEESEDAARAAEIDAALTRFCTGTDAALARLKRVHARNRAVLRRLARYEARVE